MDIDSIHEYCDRWCARCSFTTRCRVYAMLDVDEPDPEAGEAQNAEFLAKLQSMIAETLDKLAAEAKRRGIDLSVPDPEADALLEEEQAKAAAVENHDLVRSARAYGDQVTAWFQKYQPLFQEKEEILESLFRMELPGTDTSAVAAEIRDALEVIQWYQYQIYMKLTRALTLSEADGTQTPPRDSDGSAKVALIALDRSIGAWSRLRDHVQVDRDGILDVLVHLDRLRRETERTFPEARSFIRPGFDTAGK